MFLVLDLNHVDHDIVPVLLHCSLLIHFGIFIAYCILLTSGLNILVCIR